MLKSLLVSTLLILSFQGKALAETSVDPALQIVSVSVTEVESQLFDLDPRVELPTNPLGEITMIIDGMIAIGKKIWPIVNAGRPVINTKLIPAISILPQLENPAGVMLQMANWSVPKVKSYRVSFRNGFKSEVVGFTYTIYFQYNGNLNGVGKYIANLKVAASDIYAAWGFNFDAVTELVGISNIGSAEAPVASGIVQIAYTVKGLLNESRSAQSFFVDGTGNIQLLNN